MNVVLDASVIVRWLFNDPDQEPLTEEATALVAASVADGSVVQPVHWLAEVGAVLARKTPQSVEYSLHLLNALNWRVAADIQVMQRAGRLAVDLNHPLFDTLYHAVALENDAMLITADRQYLTKAQSLGRIAGLEHWRGVV